MIERKSMITIDCYDIFTLSDQMKVSNDDKQFGTKVDLSRVYQLISRDTWVTSDKDAAITLVHKRLVSNKYAA